MIGKTPICTDSFLHTSTPCKFEDALDKIRQRLIEFGEKIKVIQHYCYHTKIFSLSKIMGKLLTRIWWIYHSSSPVMKPLYDYDKN
mgnify:CR=1 FL=1